MLLQDLSDDIAKINDEIRTVSNRVRGDLKELEIENKRVEELEIENKRVEQVI